MRRRLPHFGSFPGISVLLALCFHLTFSPLPAHARGEVVVWGSQLMPEPDAFAGVVGVAAGESHSLGLRADGSVVAWGSNTYRECEVPLPNADFLAIAAGDAHSLGLRADGSIEGWGDDSFGQSSPGAPNTGFVAAAAGRRHSLGLKADGSVTGWGDDYYDQNAPPVFHGDVSTVAAGFFHSVALLENTISPATLQSARAAWRGGRVVVSWRMIDIDGELSFDVARRAAPGPYVVLDGVAIEHEGGAFRFEDRTTEPGRTYAYRVVVLEDGRAVTSFEESVTAPGLHMSLETNYPNPFNPATHIPFVIDRARSVTLAVYDVSGRRVRTLVDKRMPAGRHEAQWDGRDEHGRVVTSGAYFVRLEAGRVFSRKVVLLK